MIVKMKKLTLFCTQKKCDKTLQVLRDLKVLHVENINKPNNLSVDNAEKELNKLIKSSDILNSYESSNQTSKNINDLSNKTLNVSVMLKELDDQKADLENEIKRIENFSNFCPQKVKKLKEENVFVKLYQFNKKEKFNIPEHVKVIKINQNKNDIFSIAISNIDFSLTISETIMPIKSLDELKDDLLLIDKKIEENKSLLCEYASHKEKLENEQINAKDKFNFEYVKGGMCQLDNISYIQGYIPYNNENDIIKAAKKYGWAYKIAEIKESDNPPTFLKNPKWVDPIKAVFSVIGVVPGYKELDVSAIFLLFLSIFFGILIGDAGYGLLFILITFLAQIKNKNAPRYIFHLLYLMSSFAVIWGALTANYFGITFKNTPLVIDTLSNNWLIGYGNKDIAANNVMFLCFIIATVHLVIGHLWNFFRKINSWQSLTDLGWIFSTITMFYAVGYMVLNNPFPPIMIWFLITGISLITLSLILQKSYFGLVTLVLDVISNFVDIISYVRLYAVGAASYAIANAFNTMAIEAYGSNGIILGSIIAALTLFGGHTLNILLGAMGILVHGIRLNTLEFSSHAGIQWGGIHFKPFKKETENI